MKKKKNIQYLIGDVVGLPALLFRVYHSVPFYDSKLLEGKKRSEQVKP